MHSTRASDAAAIAFILEHCRSESVPRHRQLSHVARDAPANLEVPAAGYRYRGRVCGGGGKRGIYLTLRRAASARRRRRPRILPLDDEFEAITLNYTSGRPVSRSALYHHRGTYLNTLSQIIHHGLNSDSIYLWIATNVPRQRLVLLLGDGRDRWHACLFPCGG